VSGADPARVRLRRIAGTLLAAAAGGLLCVRLGTPLPWMLGPLFTTALLGMAGVRVGASGRLRNLGQWTIGVALGLYFTPEVVGMLPRLAPALVAGMAWALLLGYLFYRWLLWANPEMRADRAGVFFASAIGGASEMAVLAERHGGAIDRVAAAHSLRVLMVVALVPFAFQFAGVTGADPAQPAAAALRPGGLAGLALAASAGVWLFGRLGVPNPWVLGPLATTAVLTAVGLPLSAWPPWASPAAQVFLGVALGSRFTPAFARAAPRWFAAVALGTLGMIAGSAAFAWALARLAALHPATVMLGTAPGGIAEMCITAKVLQLGVPVVTAFHVTRYVAVSMLTGVAYRWELRRLARAGEA
jgi:membrane AbrB-like protein